MLQSRAVKPSAKDRLIVALDVASLDDALQLAHQLQGSVGWFKVGLELYARYGPETLEALLPFAVPVFFDTKFLDIPNTVSSASRQLVGKHVGMFNLHATGGAQMMKAARQAVHDQAAALAVAPPKVIAVTILTSLNQATLAKELGWNTDMEQTVVRLAKLAQESGLDGVVASAQEVASIKAACGDDFFVVTPGVRPLWSGKDDQARVVTPSEAVANGADFIVVGRPITRSDNPKSAAERIVLEMESNG